ncbi:MAG: preprotein translocase subunit SecA [Acidimicrobiaceae bacterium]|nr:preprotein translocase subunit SecA [Ilumatobacter sp.]MCB9381711.1 preprotein translocase subunit SecA [Acidimicrobiaceae bacterium]MCO5329703.1 preprotein translocase subunit SecA [Ilumatobacteraceae bacterium]
MGILDRILRAGEGKKLKALQGLVPDINALEASMKALSDDALRGKTAEFKSRLERGETLDDILIEAFAVVREAADRTLGQRHFDVQMMGGAALHFGWVAEMKTGEGKTLVSTLPAYLNGLSGNGVHVITVNDYLARFHAEWMGRLHKFMGLDVGLILPGYRDRPAEKRASYACAITYGTNNEFGFDYLRDNMAAKLEDKVQRGHHFAIIDEVDSILIDEARTPLIISGRVADAAKLYYRFASIVRSLKRDVDYEVEEDKRVVVPLEAGIERVEQALGIENLYDEVQQNLVHQMQVALKAKELYKRDKDYIIQNGEVKIVDEFTGRVLEGRRWSEGIHQAVEAKEGVKIKEENQTLATITLQNYFRMYDKLAGMTGTAQTEAAELANTYELQVVPIPTNKPVVRADQADLIYKGEVGKFGSVVDDIAERYERGQPVLVGTISVEKSEYLSRQLNKRGIPHEVLNAKQHTREAQIVAQAGRMHAVTVSTNMAGRGVDILLGGNPEGLARHEVVKEGHDPAVLVDDFALPMPLDQMPDEFKEARAAAMARYAELEREFKTSCKAEGDKVRELGGLYVLGTERHESRRIDNQLRGRSGRQGDPGESRFYLSLDDELMRLFATGALSWVMSRALPDDEAIEAKMVTKAIERAQTTVEQRNAEIRKNVLKYDEVMNEQRKVIYARRDQILEGADLKVAAMEYLSDAVDALIDTHCVSEAADEWDLDGLVKELKTFWPSELTMEQLEAFEDADDIYDLVMENAKAYYEQRETELTPVIMRDVERQVMLRIIDQRWREHLEEMDYLQEGINLRAMGQKDPLTEWQREGYEMFGAMMKGIAQDFVKYVMHVQVVRREEPKPVVQNMQLSSSDFVQADGIAAAARAAAAAGEIPAEAAEAKAPAAAKQQTVVKDEWSKTPRNAPCPCGSGKKFKMCHGATQ